MREAFLPRLDSSTTCGHTVAALLLIRCHGYLWIRRTNNNNMEPECGGCQPHRTWPNHLSNKDTVQSHREYIGVNPYTSGKTATVRVCIEVLTTSRGLHWCEHLQVTGGEVNQCRCREEQSRRKGTSLGGIHGKLLLSRPWTGMDGVIFWPASRVIVGLMRMSEYDTDALSSQSWVLMNTTLTSYT